VSGANERHDWRIFAGFAQILIAAPANSCLAVS
jgi:hypothetical protein